MIHRNEVSEITFEWSDLPGLDDSLTKLHVSPILPSDTVTAQHLTPLKALASQLGATDTAKRNAHVLGKGYSDLAFLLLEPTDDEDQISYSEKGGLPSTIQLLDEVLRESSKGTRNWRNTCIMDTTPLRSRLIREQESHRTRATNDGLAYKTSNEMLNLLQPDVLVVCQCVTSSSSNSFAQSISSDLSTCSKMYLRTFGKGKRTIVINCFHPMWATKYAQDLDDVVKFVRLSMFQFVVLSALNILEGRMVTGSGPGKLRDSFWGVCGSGPPKLLPNGTLKRNEDTRLKISLHPDASPEIKRIWDEMEAECREKETIIFNELADLVRDLEGRAQGNQTEDCQPFLLEDLKHQLPSVRESATSKLYQ